MKTNKPNLMLIEKLYTFIFIIKFLFSISKKYILISSLRIFFSSINVLSLSYTVTVVVFLLERADFKMCVFGIGIFLITKMILSQSANYIKMKERIEREKLNDSVKRIILEHSAHIPYKYLEDPDYLDLLEKSNAAIHNEDCIDVVLTSFFELLEKIILAVCYSAALIVLDWKLICIIVAVLITMNLIYKMQGKNRMKFFADNVLINRRFFYYTDTLIEPALGKDFRVFGIGNLLQNKFEVFGKKMIATYKRYLHKSFLLQCITEGCLCIQNIIVYGHSVYQFFLVRFPFSVLSFRINTALSFSDTVSKIFHNVTRLAMGIELGSPLVSILKIKKETDSGFIEFDFEQFEYLEFKNVYFKYPNSDTYILNGVSFKINKGDRICMVGLNGAGKTTIVKLISRLFKPDAGDILLNGISIYDIRYDDFMKYIATVFQDFGFIAVPINENIAAAKDINGNEISAVLKSSGLFEKINRLDNKDCTYLNPSINEDGIYLSGGEMQRLAFARCLYKNAPLIILDEPASALDADAESNFYKTVKALDSSKTVIFISHRMTSAIFSNKILEVVNGSIAFFDTMENLLNNPCSLFVKLYTQQKENYQEL